MTDSGESATDASVEGKGITLTWGDIVLTDGISVDNPIVFSEGPIPIEDE